MDAYKILSRGSKRSKSSKGTASIPSTGEPNNPQIFAHDADFISLESPEEKPSKKRKRGEETAEKSELPPELDFFKTSSWQPKLEAEPANGTDHAADNYDQQIHNSIKDLSVGKRKQTLRRLKIKIFLLDGRDTLVEQTNAPKKRRKGLGEKEAKPEKDGNKYLWPAPVESFTQLRTQYGISKRLLENILDQGYTTPTEVQLAGLPALMGNPLDWYYLERVPPPDLDRTASLGNINTDLLAIAPTGCGKTLAFLIPVINALLHERKSNKDTKNHRPRAIVVAPTKELAAQIVNEGRKLTDRSGVKVALMRKNMTLPGVGKEINEKRDQGDDSESEEGGDASGDEGEQKGHSKTAKKKSIVKAHLLVSTPGNLARVLQTGPDSTATLPNVRYLILDEADVLLDPLFRSQTLAIWNACNSPSLRVSLWSATISSSIEELTRSTISERWNSLSNTTNISQAPLVRLVVGLKDAALPTITHTITYCATEQGKLMALRQLLHPTARTDESTAALRPPFLVFTQTIPRAIALHAELKYDIPPEAGGSIRIAVLHADLSDSARDTVMTKFRRGEIWVLITTDLLARGVDFRGVNGVVNYDVPTSAAGYVHRAGRTGRAGRRGGVAVTLYTQEEVAYVKAIANVIATSQKLQNERLESQKKKGGVEQWLLDALPTPTKAEKRKLKREGYLADKARAKGKGMTNKKPKNKISTKSGYERKMENKKKGAIKGSKNRKA